VVNDSPGRLGSVAASWLVTVTVVALNVAYAIAHGYNPSIELLAALLVVGGFSSGHTLDVKHGKDRDANDEPR
jgi:hypothetical protein